ncbi:MAG: carboxypeptidase-like regulatory domain-containing protein [Lacunisphaera sp.]
MKKRVSIIVVLLLVFGLGLILSYKAPPVVRKVTASSASPTATQLPPSANKLKLAEQRIEIINAWERAREKDVEFWGKVIDQHDEPVANVAVTATITSHQIPLPSAQPQLQAIYSVLTDAKGIFYVRGNPGRGFTIETMKKAGYILNPELQKRTDNLHWYNYDQLDPKGFKPDANAPVVFRMWKIGKSQKLIEGDGFYGIVPDGSVYTVDLLAHEDHQGQGTGDFEVKIMRSPNVKLGTRGYDWSCEIEGVGGGVIETRDEFMYSAPETGYQSHYQIKISASDVPWTDDVTRQLYLMSRSGKVYARLDVEIFANYQDKAVFSVKYFANPNGSRNLEYDSTQNVQGYPSRINPPAASATPNQ